MRVGRNLGALLAAIFLIASAEELWWRFVPNYLRVLGASIAAVAAYGTFKDLLDALYQFPGGLLTQRIGYRNALVGFNAIAIAGYVAFALAGSWVVLVVALPLVMAWQSFSLPATFSLIGDTLPGGQRSIAFAYQSIVRRVPIIVAPIVGGLIITHFGALNGTRVAIWCGTAIAVAALILQAIRYKLPIEQAKQIGMRTLLRDAPKLPPKLKSLLLSDCFVRFGQGIGEIFIVIYAVNVVGISAAAFGWLIGIAMATSVAVYIPVARIADRQGREAWVLLTYGFFALFPLLLAFGKPLWLLALAFVAMGLREIGEPPRKAMIVDLARPDRRSVDVGTYYLVRGLIVFPASLIGGALWKVSPSTTFLGASTVAAIGVTVFLFRVMLKNE
jgi:MFS family permease